MLTLIYVYTFWFALPLLVIAAMLWGGWAERTVAWLFVAALLGTQLLKSSVATSFLSLEAGVLLVDGALLVALGWIAIRTGKWWIICVTAFQLIAVLGHLGKLVNPGMSRMAYGLMESVSSYPALIALAIGIYLHRRRTTGGGAGTSSRIY
jgi:hypothetical protein